jgi:hypothetical protein
MVANQIETGRRNQRREFFDQLQRFHDDMARAIAPAALEAIEQLAVRQNQ